MHLGYFSMLFFLSKEGVIKKKIMIKMKLNN